VPQGKQSGKKGQEMDTNLNRVTITGYLVRDSMLRKLPSGKSVCDIRIACHRRCQDKLTGSWVQWVDHCDARIIGSLAHLTNSWLRKDRGVAIEGQLSNQQGCCNDPEHSWGVMVLVQQLQILPQATERSDLNTPYTVDALPGIDAPLEGGAPPWSDAPLKSSTPPKGSAPRVESPAPLESEAIERPTPSRPPVPRSSRQSSPQSSPQPPRAATGEKRRAKWSYGSIDAS
jgi:single-strand DNA-binding protein